MPPLEKFTGLIREQMVNVGSKSEHRALVLHTDSGAALRLRLAGTQPFEIPQELKKFVGQRVTLEGQRTASGQVIVSDAAGITVLPTICRPPPRRRPPSP
jgi:hypothetical protein